MTANVRKLVFASVIAALYVVLTIIFMPISFFSVQFRISEILTILPYFFPVAVPGLYIGCIIANIFSPYGFADILIGSTATLIAALITMKAGKSENNETASVKALACIPPVAVNAVFIGALLAAYMTSAGETDSFWAAFAVNAVQIGFGQAAVIYLLGLPLMIYLPITGAIDRLKEIININPPEDEQW